MTAKPRVYRAAGVWWVTVGTRTNIRRSWREAIELALTIVARDLG